MKSLAFLYILLLLSFDAVAQIEVYIPRTPGAKKEHERAIMTLPTRNIVVGSNLANIRVLSPSLTTIQTFQLDSNCREIRDLAYSSRFLLAMQSNDTSHLIRIARGASQPEVVHLDWQDQPMFFDGLAFDNDTLFLIGDPVANEFCTFRSLDGGLNWEPTPTKIQANQGEAAYAASGQTNQVVDGHFYFVSGGLSARFFHSPDQGATWEISALPYPSCPTCGPYAMALSDNNEIVTVGGNYLAPHEAKNTCYYSTDAGKTWQAPKKGPSGYRSCVIKVNECYYACGTNGIDCSKNGGKTWKKIYNGNCLSMTTIGNTLYVSLANGSYLILKID